MADSELECQTKLPEAMDSSVVESKVELEEAADEKKSGSDGNEGTVDSEVEKQALESSDPTKLTEESMRIKPSTETNDESELGVSVVRIKTENDDSVKIASPVIKSDEDYVHEIKPEVDSVKTITLSDPKLSEPYRPSVHLNDDEMSKFERINRPKYFENATKLHKAVCEDQYENVKELIQFEKMDVNARDENRLTPMHYIFLGKMKFNSVEIAQMLIANGADLLAKDKKGHCVIELMLRFNLFKLIPREPGYLDVAYAYALDVVSRKDCDATKVEMLKIFLGFHQDKIHEILTTEMQEKLAKRTVQQDSKPQSNRDGPQDDVKRGVEDWNTILLKASEYPNLNWDVSPSLLLFFVHRTKTLYFPPDGNTPIHLWVKNGLNPFLIAFLVRRAANGFLKNSSYDYLNSRNAGGHQIMPMLLTLCENPYAALTALCFAGASVDIVPKGYPSLLHLAAESMIMTKDFNRIMTKIIFFKKTTNLDEVKLIFTTSLQIVAKFLEARMLRTNRSLAALVKEAVPDAFMKVFKMYLEKLDSISGKLHSDKLIREETVTVTSLFTRLYNSHDIDPNFCDQSEDMTLLQLLVKNHVNYACMRQVAEVLLSFKKIDCNRTTAKTPPCPLVFALCAGDRVLAELFLAKTDTSQLNLSPLLIPSEGFTADLVFLMKDKNFRLPEYCMSPDFMVKCQAVGQPVADEFFHFKNRYEASLNQLGAGLPVYS
ncbi:hypothetical protein HDE_13159 [Halotydeus destructor]|nr:hypothetical protein HDE_13159 [Halotydeus destructor]